MPVVDYAQDCDMLGRAQLVVSFRNHRVLKLCFRD